MKRTTPPMTLDAMRAFAVSQVAHYQELVAVLDKIKVDPLSVLPQAALPRRRRTRRTRRPRQPGEAPAPSAAKAYALAALRKLRLATVREIVAHAKRAGWGTLSKHPDVVMTIELKKMVARKELRRMKGEGRAVRYALAAPSKAAARKLAAAEALVNGTPVAPVAADGLVN